MTAIRGTVAADLSRRGAASHEVERLAIQMKEAVCVIRDRAGNEFSYALVYELRKRLGRVVASLGEGLPDSASHSAAAELLDSVVE